MSDRPKKRIEVQVYTDILSAEENDYFFIFFSYLRINLSAKRKSTKRPELKFTEVLECL